MTPTEQSFVDVVAREIAEDRARKVTPGREFAACLCGAQRIVQVVNCPRHGCTSGACLHAPSDRLHQDFIAEAAILLGMLRASNGMATLEEIVDAFAFAEIQNVPVADVVGPCTKESADEAKRQLFRAIAAEALGGAKVEAEYGRIFLSRPGSAPAFRFSVPLLAVEGGTR